MNSITSLMMLPFYTKHSPDLLFVYIAFFIPVSTFRPTIFALLVRASFSRNIIDNDDDDDDNLQSVDMSMLQQHAYCTFKKKKRSLGLNPEIWL